MDREALKSLIHNVINGDEAAAAANLHTFAVSKMQDVAGIGQSQVTPTEEPEED